MSITYPSKGRLHSNHRIPAARLIMFLLFFPAYLQNLYAQTLPQEFDYSRYSEFLIDAGYGWAGNSMFHPLRIPVETESLADSAGWIGEHLSKYSDAARSVAEESRTGLAGLTIAAIELSKQKGDSAKYAKTALTTHVWVTIRFKSHWYSRMEVRATNEAASLSHFSGVTRGISRLGINASEVDQSVFGYENDWATIEYGRTREIWGPLSGNNLVPSGETPAWEEFKLEGRYKRLTYRYFYGFLESIDLRSTDEIIQRYIVGRALEYRNFRNLVIGVSELTILSGRDRPVDWAFLNPISIELEIEQNKRGNSRANSSYANSVWVSHFDWLPLRSLRVAGSILLDEFQFDQADRDKGRTDLTGYLVHLAWTPLRTPTSVTAYFDWVRIGTYTLMHNLPYTVFSTRGEFMGNPIGNDAEKVEVGGRVIFRFPLIAELGFGALRSGGMSLIRNPYGIYDDIQKQPFPSGQVRSNRYANIQLHYRPSENISLGLNGHLDLWRKGSDSAMNALQFEARLQIKPLVKSF